MWYLIAGLFAAIWAGLDAYSRRSYAIACAIGAFLMPAIVIPVWVAYRPLMIGETREGGRAWNVLRNFAITWTLVMTIATTVILLNKVNAASYLQGHLAEDNASVTIFFTAVLLSAAWFVP